jgi:allantoicase
MASLSFSELLKSNGWTESATPSFAEKAGAGATVYYAYKNKCDNHLALAVFSEAGIVRFRVYDPSERDVAWLQMKLDSEIDLVVAKIVKRQDEITRAGTFGFYFSIAEFEGVSILAWEQFEDDYQ